MEQLIQKAVGRISRMEQCFDTLLQADPAAIRADAFLREMLKALMAYYEGGQWLRDYELDEQGLLPRNLKRGVLAQDAVYDFLEQALSDCTDGSGWCIISPSPSERSTSMENENIIFIPEEDQPYSDIVVTEGRYLFLSGLVSEELSTRDEAYGSIEFETNRILDNLKVILERYGSDMDHVVRIDVILAKWADKDAMNAEYVKHFRRDRLPARVCFGDVSIAGNCKVEMTVIASRK